MLHSIVPRLSASRLTPNGIAGAVQAQVVLEGDDRREDRHLRRAAQDLRAVDDVPAHDHELLVGQLAPACCRISFGVRTLPMSCISADRPNSRSSRPSIPSARAWPMVRIETFTMCVNV